MTCEAGGQWWLRSRHRVCYESVPEASVIDSVRLRATLMLYSVGVFALDIHKTTDKELYEVDLVLRAIRVPSDPVTFGAASNGSGSGVKPQPMRIPW